MSTRSSGSTRGLTDEQESSITELWLLTFTPDGEFEGVTPIPASDINPTADPNKYDVRLSLSAGQHRVVLMANMSDFTMWLPLFNPNNEALIPVSSGDLIWSKLDVAAAGSFVASESTAGNGYNWTAATTGGTGSDGSVCPQGWRMPTGQELSDLINDTNMAGGWGSASGTYTTTSYSNSGFLIKAKDDPTQQLFLPGSAGYYWSSTEAGVNAWRLDFSSYYSTGSSYWRSKSFVNQVRCVRNADGTRAKTRAGVVIDDMRGQSYEDIMAELVGDGEVKMYETGGSIPMWGESGIVTAAEDNDIEIDLHRAIARIDVGAGAYTDATGWAGLPNFEMTSVTVVRPNNKYAVIPDPANLDVDPTNDIADGTPIVPSIPGAATADPDDDAEAISVEDSVAAFTYATAAGAPITNQIYVPEALIASAAHEDRMALVVGGYYNGSEEPQYYRVDFKRADGTFRDVVRNHLYRFDISSVRGVGSATAEEAYNSYASYMTVSVVDWQEEHFATELGR